MSISMIATKSSLCALWLCLALVCGVASAQASIPWDELTPEQKHYLQKVEPKWDQIPAKRQQRMLRGAERWSQMSEQERTEAKARMRRWKFLSPLEKRELSERAKFIRDMTPEQRERLQQMRKDFRALPEEAQQAFRACEQRKRAGESLDCRGLWPPALREKYADLPDPFRMPHERKNKGEEPQPKVPNAGGTR